MDARSGRGRNVAYSSEWETTPPPFHKPETIARIRIRGTEREEGEREGNEREREREANANQEDMPGDRSMELLAQYARINLSGKEGLSMLRSCCVNTAASDLSFGPKQDVCAKRLRLYADTNVTRAPVLHRAGALYPRARDGPDTKRRSGRRRRRETSSNTGEGIKGKGETRRPQADDCPQASNSKPRIDSEW